LPENECRELFKYLSEIARKATINYLKKLEEGYETTSRKLLAEFGEDFRKKLKELGFEEAVKGYEKMRREEWRRLSTIQAR